MKMTVGKMHSTQQILVLKQCNSHDKIKTHRLDKIPRFSSREMITSDSTDNSARSQSCSDFNTISNRHKQRIYSVFSVCQTTVIVYSILLFAICAIVVECRQLPQINIQNAGESSILILFSLFLLLLPFWSAHSGVVYVVAVLMVSSFSCIETCLEFCHSSPYQSSELGIFLLK